MVVAKKTDLGVDWAEAHVISSRVILSEVADYYDVRMRTLLAPKGRSEDVTEARMVVMLLLRELCGMDADSIARMLFSKRATVSSWISRARGKIRDDARFRSSYMFIGRAVWAEGVQFYWSAIQREERRRYVDTKDASGDLGGIRDAAAVSAV